VYNLVEENNTAVSC